MSSLISKIAANDPLNEKVTERREAISRDLKAFQRDASPFLVEEVIARRRTWLPDDLAPWAPGVVLASDYLLRASNYRQGARRPRGWLSRCKGGVFLKFPDDRSHLRVRQCGQFWTVERTVNCVGEMLAYPYGPLPIFTRTYQAAMRLAEYCHRRPRGTGSSLRWVFEDADKFFGIVRSYPLSPLILAHIATVPGTKVSAC